jgi:hypothetical protein
MAVTSKTQLAIDIAASTFTAPQQVILDNIIDSYENIFSQLTTVQRDALTPATGLMIYNTDNDRYEYWNGSAWLGIGQDLSTPITIKVDISSAELLTMFSLGKELIPAPGVGYGISFLGVAYRKTYGSVVYDFPTGLYIYMNGKTAATDNFVQIGGSDMNSASNRSGNLLRSMTGIDGLVENASMRMQSGTSNPTTGDGTLTVWVTYSIITW